MSADRLPDITPAIAISDWSCGYLDDPIVRDFDFALGRGEVACVVGSNGAGKSTLLRSLYGTIRRFSGALTLGGERIETLAPAERMARGLSFVPQGRCNFPHLSVAENLQLAAYTLPKADVDAAIAAQVDRFPVLRAKWRQRAGNLSGGEQQMMEMAMVLVAGPSVLLVDEPSLGLSPKMMGEVFATLRTLAGSGLTVIIVEQNVRGALAISDRAVVMDLGRKVMDGTPDEILGDPRISAVFLGGMAQA